MPITQISPSELNQRLAAGGTTLIDVRTPGEFAAGHVPGAVNMPLDRLDAQALAGAGSVHVICQGGARSRQACEQLAAASSTSPAVPAPGRPPACRSRAAVPRSSGSSARSAASSVPASSPARCWR
jgi:rhodanese-related sulfurtransferase